VRIIQTKLLFWADGMAVTPGLILLRPDRAGDQALIAHETRHTEQMREFGTGTFWWRYLTSRAFRLQAELDAYRVQLALAPWALDGMAQYLATRYFLKITKPQARALLLRRAEG
jgi:hypothetical protein